MPAERRSAALCGARTVSVRPVPARCRSGRGPFLFRLVPARCCSGCGLFLFRLVLARCCSGCGLFLFVPFPLGAVPAAGCFCFGPFPLGVVPAAGHFCSGGGMLRSLCPLRLPREPRKTTDKVYFSVVSPTLLSPCSAVRNPDAAACTRPRNMPFRCREQQYRRHDHIRLPGRSSHRVRRCSRFGDTVASSCLRSYTPPLLRRSSYKRGRSRPRENNSFIIG